MRLSSQPKFTESNCERAITVIISLYSPRPGEAVNIVDNVPVETDDMGKLLQILSENLVFHIGRFSIKVDFILAEVVFAHKMFNSKVLMDRSIQTPLLTLAVQPETKQGSRRALEIDRKFCRLILAQLLSCERPPIV